MNSGMVLAWSPFDPWHMLVLGVVALLLFGKRLPEVGRSLGRGIAEFKKGLRDVREELGGEDEAEKEPPKPKLKPPAQAENSNKTAESPPKWHEAEAAKLPEDER